MFKDVNPEALIERAYDVQSDRIAFVQKSDREQDEITTETVREEHEQY